MAAGTIYEGSSRSTFTVGPMNREAEIEFPECEFPSAQGIALEIGPVQVGNVEEIEAIYKNSGVNPNTPIKEVFFVKVSEAEPETNDVAGYQWYAIPREIAVDEGGVDDGRYILREDGTVIAEDAVISQGSIVDDRCFIGRGVVVDQWSIIGQGTEIECGAKITRGSKIGPWAVVKTMAHMSNVQGFAESRVGQQATIIDTEARSGANMGSFSIVKKCKFEREVTVGSETVMTDCNLGFSTQVGDFVDATHVTLWGGQIGNGHTGSRSTLSYALIEGGSFGEDTQIKGEVDNRITINSVTADNEITIEAGANLQNQVVLGNHVRIGAYATLSSFVTLETGVNIGAQAILGKSVKAEDNVIVGARANVGEYSRLLQGAYIKPGRKVRARTIVAPKLAKIKNGDRLPA